MNLQRYWIRFQPIVAKEVETVPDIVFKLGCGVTGYHLQDALCVVQNAVFSGNPLPEIESIAENVDVSTLDQKHVLPNMGMVISRGVWFPLGYSGIY